MKTITISLPEYFANALINDDYRNLDYNNYLELKKALDYHDVTSNNCLSCTDAGYTSRFNNQLCTMLDYTFKTD